MISIFGMRLELALDDEVINKLNIDFSGFYQSTSNLLRNKSLKISSFKSNEYDQENEISLRHIFTFRDAKIFQNLHHRIIKYPNAICVYLARNSEIRIYSDDANLTHEISYLFILSKIGKFLDLKGIHKLHAAALSFKGKEVIAIGESTAGKSSLVMGLLDNDYKLISDDLVFFKKSEELISFPLRIGLPKGSKKEDFPESTEVIRRRFGKKLVLKIKNIKMIDEAEVSFSRKFYILKKSDQNLIKKSTISQKVYYLVKYLVIGIDTPIILEFFWETGPKDFVLKIMILLSRLNLALKLLFKEEFYTVYSTSAKDLVKLIKDDTIN